MRTADSLVASRPLTKCNLRKAQSAAYYALFHCLARDAADMLVGTRNRSDKAWLQVYRALNHGKTVNLCNHADINKFPPDIQKFAVEFKQAQLKRELADYHPILDFDVDAVKTDIDTARDSIDVYMSINKKHRTAFAAYLLIENKNSKKENIPATRIRRNVQAQSDIIASG